MSSPEGQGADSAEVATATVPSATDAVRDALTAELGDAVQGTESKGDELWVRVRADAWRRTGEVCRNLGFTYFCFLSGIDWMPHTWPNPAHAGDAPADEPEEAAEEAAPDDTAETPAGRQTGYAGGDSRFQVLARLHSIDRKMGVILKADLDDERPTVETWSAVFPGADWHERETWEMYGFDFTGHSNLSHLYLPGEFEGFPLRKDFPLLAREVKPWPGLVDPEPMPDETEAETAAGEAEAQAGADGDADSQ